MEFDQQDVEDLATCGWKEASGEPFGGMPLVMWCVRNRIGAPGFPKSLYQVIYQPGAFSWTSPTNPEHARKPISGDVQYALALEQAREVLAAPQSDDKSLGSHYYANLATMDKDGWFARHIAGPDEKGMPEHPLLLTFGKHTFYR